MRIASRCKARRRSSRWVGDRLNLSRHVGFAPIAPNGASLLALPPSESRWEHKRNIVLLKRRKMRISEPRLFRSKSLEIRRFRLIGTSW